MLQTYGSALAPGTYANREKQARCFITFAVLYDVPYLSPLTVHVCMYSQYLANKFKSVGSVKNYMSGARCWVLEHGGNIAAFLGHEQSNMIKALTKSSEHVVQRAYPLTLCDISLIVSYLDKARNAPLAVKPCILIGYSCYLRCCNLLPLTCTTIPGPHTLLAKDVIDCGSALKVIINSTKTRAVPYSLMVPSCDHSQLCPVMAWRRYTSIVRPAPSGPAFLLSRCTPLHPTLVVKLMRDALSGEPELNVQQISMHSLRRGAAQQAAAQGSSIDDIMFRGAWNSRSGVKPYLASNHST